MNKATAKVVRHVSQTFRDAWWEAELQEAGRQLTDCLDASTAWTPAHLVYDAAMRDDWAEDFGGGAAGDAGK